MAAEVSVFQRMLSRRIWLQKQGLQLSFWSLGAAFSGVLLVGLCFPVFDLLLNRGQIVWNESDSEALARQYYTATIEAPPVLENTGLRAVLWNRRGCPMVDTIAPPLSRLIPLRSNRSALASLSLLAALLVVVRWFCQTRMTRAAAGISQATAGSLRSLLYRQILRLGPSDLDRHEHAEVQALFIESVEKIGHALSRWLTLIPYHPLSIALLLMYVLLLDWSIAIQSLVPMLAGFWLLRWENEAAHSRQALAKSRAASDLRILSEGLRKSRLVRGYHMESFEQSRFHKHLDRYSQEVHQGEWRRGWQLWSIRVLGALVLAISGYLIASRHFAETVPSDLPRMISLLAGFISIWSLLGGLFDAIQEHRTVEVEGARVLRFLAAVPEVGQAVGAKFIDPVSQNITFEGVCYQREGRPLLNQLELRIPAGGTTALVSIDPLESRALAAIIPRFLEPQAGRILFDGEDIAWGTLESIRAEAIYVGGDDPCFTGTVNENISCGDARYGLSEVMEAAKLVHAHQFIQRLSQGYETPLGEHGEQLDIGQSFCLGLARAIIRNPAVLIIEEPSEAIDAATKDALDDAYSRISANRTVLFIPSRLSTVRRCDRVVVIDQGRVDAIGKQPELVKTCDLYRHWEYITFNAFRR
ncbi:MAG: ABC transporter ATP-binding protein [Planctomycetota bacterium]|nr:MAG: ABC transporter ATP-binding protein [Planctomycetota bacterium]